MNLYRLTVIVFRVFGIDCVLNTLLWLTDFPAYALTLLHSPPGYFQTRAEIALAMFVVRLLLNVGIGWCLIARSRPWSHSLMELIAGEPPHDIDLQDAWPPPPKQSVDTRSASRSEQNLARTIRHAASLILRADGITWLLTIIPVELTSLPIEIFGAISYRGGYWKMQYSLSIAVIVMKSLISLAVGLYFLFSPDSLANRIAYDLVSDAETEDYETTLQTDAPVLSTPATSDSDVSGDGS